MAVTMSDKKWYVIRAISGKEKKVKQYIESEISRLKLTDYVAQVLIPMDDRFNTAAGWTLFAGIVALGLSSVSGKYFGADKPHLRLKEKSDLGQCIGEQPDRRTGIVARAHDPTPKPPARS